MPDDKPAFPVMDVAIAFVISIVVVAAGAVLVFYMFFILKMEEDFSDDAEVQSFLGTSSSTNSDATVDSQATITPKPIHHVKAWLDGIPLSWETTSLLTPEQAQPDADALSFNTSPS